MVCLTSLSRGLALSQVYQSQTAGGLQPLVLPDSGGASGNTHEHWATEYIGETSCGLSKLERTVL